MIPELLVLEPFGRLPRWAVDRSKGAYLGWFRNEFGNVWVFLADGETFRMAGDLEAWRVHELRPTPDDIERFEACDGPSWPDEAPLNREERLWLMSCLACGAAIARGSLEAQVEGA